MSAIRDYFPLLLLFVTAGTDRVAKGRKRQKNVFWSEELFSLSLCFVVVDLYLIFRP